MKNIFYKAPNYFISFLICIGLSIMALLTENPKTYWLLVSDLNVALFLLLAYLLDPDKKWISTYQVNWRVMLKIGDEMKNTQIKILEHVKVLLLDFDTMETYHNGNDQAPKN